MQTSDARLSLLTRLPHRGKVLIRQPREIFDVVHKARPQEGEGFHQVVLLQEKRFHAAEGSSRGAVAVATSERKQDRREARLEHRGGTMLPRQPGQVVCSDGTLSCTTLLVAESSRIRESGGAFQTEKTAIISFSRVFLRKFCTWTELTQSFCTIFLRSRIERARFS